MSGDTGDESTFEEELEGLRSDLERLRDTLVAANAETVA